MWKVVVPTDAHTFAIYKNLTLLLSSVIGMLPTRQIFNIQT
jgi:hypothetical protein